MPSGGGKSVASDKGSNAGRSRLFAAAAVGLVSVGLAVAAVVFLVPGRAPEPWGRVDTEDIHAVAFHPTDSRRLYFGHHGGLLESGDGGQTWSPTALVGHDAMSVAVPTEELIWVAGHDVLLTTADGGTTWQPAGHTLPSLDVHAFVTAPGDPARAWAGIAGVGLYETTDAGATWQLRLEGHVGQITAYGDGDVTTLLAVTDKGLGRSTDGGATWQPAAYSGAPLAALAATSDGRTIYAATIRGLKRSTDGAASWESTGFEGSALAVAVSPSDPNTVVVIDQDGHVYRSADVLGPGPARQREPELTA